MRRSAAVTPSVERVGGDSFYIALSFRDRPMDDPCCPGEQHVNPSLKMFPDSVRAIIAVQLSL